MPPNVTDHFQSSSHARQTVACLLTPPGEGGISVIEVCGPNASSVLTRLFHSSRGKRFSDIEPGQLLYGTLRRDEVLLDEVILACVEAGAHAVFEVNCHGGAIASKRVFAALEAEGVIAVDAAERLARLQRLNRMDTIAAEAAERIPRAPTLLGARVLLDQYRGALSDALRAIRGKVDTAMDGPAVREALAKLQTTASFGMGLINPPRVALVGKPNVGKSTLANALLRFDRMIVHHIPGTTRDTIEEVFSIDGVPFVLVDMAGLRQTEDAIEHEGVLRGHGELRRADIVVLVFDGSEPLQDEDLAFLGNTRLSVRVIPVFNKSDLGESATTEKIEGALGTKPLKISAAQETGIEALEWKIVEAVYPEGVPESGAPVIFTRRQSAHLDEALAAAKDSDRERLAVAIDKILDERILPTPKRHEAGCDLV